MSAFVPSRPGLVQRLALLLRMAGRNLRGGVRGFAIVIAAIALGVAAIVGVGGLSRALTEGLAREGRTILGADAAFVLLQREAEAEERRILAAKGDVAPVAYLRAMARVDDGAAALAEVKAVEGRWPRQGTATLDPPQPTDAALAVVAGRHGAIADPILLARLGLVPGQTLRLGSLELEVRAALLEEPDKLAGGIGFGPRLLISVEALRASGLLQPGSLVRWSYRLTLPGVPTDSTIEAVIAAVRAALPEAGFETRHRRNAAPQLARQLDRFTQFLTLVGLTALLVGGVGVANATRSFVERRRSAIATLKSVGATGGFVVALLLVELLAIALMGAVLGAALGVALPFAVSAMAGHLLPFPLAPTLDAAGAGLGVLYGVLVALTFALWPLGRAHDVPVSTLFREGHEGGHGWPRPTYLVVGGLALLALAGLAVGMAWDRRIALIYVAAAAGAFLLLRLVAAGIMAVAARLPRPRGVAARLALTNLHRPGAPTPAVILSLGLGLTLIVALGLIDGNLRRQLANDLPARAPSFFFLDIPGGDVERFEAFLASAAAGATLQRVPMLRGRIVAINGTPAEQLAVNDRVAWVLEGDRGITYAERPPENSRIVTGDWWAPDHSGEPLVSFTHDLAQGLGLAVGDRIAVNVLGRTITARLANTRTVEWQSLGINFVMVFSPNAFRGAPATHLATLTLPATADMAQETRIAREAASLFPMVSTVRVKDALEAVNAVVRQLAVAIRAASGLALLASLLVLAGALAAGNMARLKDAVVLKTLGASRPQLIAIASAEYAVLGLVAALFGVLAGALAARGIVSEVMRIPFSLDLGLAMGTALLTVLLTVVLGLLTTWRILGQKPAQHLRSL